MHKILSARSIPNLTIYIKREGPATGQSKFELVKVHTSHSIILIQTISVKYCDTVLLWYGTEIAGSTNTQYVRADILDNDCSCVVAR